MRFVIYTIIKDNYDWLSDVTNLSLDFDFLCYTNNKSLISKGESKGWEIKSLSIHKNQTDYVDIKKENFLITRWFKFYPHIHLKKYDFSLYVDANLDLKTSIKELISTFYKKDFSLGIFRHPDRKSVKEEICFAYWKKKINQAEFKILKNFYYKYKKGGEFLDTELFENNIRFTNHYSDEAKLILDKTFQLLKRYPYRDQIIFPMIISDLADIKKDIIIFESSKRYFRVKPHKVKSLKNIRRFLLAYSNNNFKKTLFFLPNLFLKSLEIFYDLIYGFRK